MRILHSGDHNSNNDARYVTSGKAVRVAYSLLVVAILAYAVFFFGRPFFILEGVGYIVAPKEDVSVPYIADVKLVHVDSGQVVFPGTLLLTVDRAGRGAALQEIRNLLANSAKEIDRVERELELARRMQASLHDRVESLSGSLEQSIHQADAFDLLTRITLRREHSEALSRWQTNQIKRRRLPDLLAKLLAHRSGLLRRRAEVLTTWENKEILAEEKGTVGSGIVTEGETVTPGHAMVHILDRSQRYIRWELPSNRLRLPRVGEPVKVLTGDIQVDGFVDEILPLTATAREGVTTARRLVVVLLEEDAGELPLEGSVTVRMPYLQLFH